MLAILGNYTFSLKSIRDFLMFRADLFQAEKSSEFLDYHLKPVMQRSWSYIKDSGDFIEKIKRITNIPGDAILVTADVVGL